MLPMSAHEAVNVTAAGGVFTHSIDKITGAFVSYQVCLISLLEIDLNLYSLYPMYACVLWYAGGWQVVCEACSGCIC